jgi:hypothetical protein
VIGFAKCRAAVNDFRPRREAIRFVAGSQRSAPKSLCSNNRLPITIGRLEFDFRCLRSRVGRFSKCRPAVQPSHMEIHKRAQVIGQQVAVAYLLSCDPLQHRTGSAWLL